jgi:hypothetical protein
VLVWYVAVLASMGSLLSWDFVHFDGHLACCSRLVLSLNNHKTLTLVYSVGLRTIFYLAVPCLVWICSVYMI